MPIDVEGHVYDFVGECLTCDVVSVFESKNERREWADNNHWECAVDFYLQARV